MSFLRRLTGQKEVAPAWPPPGPITRWPPRDASLVGAKVALTLFDPAPKMVDVVGESAYQGSIEALVGGRTSDGAKVRDHKAVLIPEPDNPYDPAAVRVYLLTAAGNVGLAGYLSREDAVAYRDVIDRVAAGGGVVACLATVTGGWDRGPGDRGSFGVRLAIGTPDDLVRELDA